MESGADMDEQDADSCSVSTHLIRQNPVDSIAVQLDEPVEPLQLVIVHVTVRCQNRRLDIQTNHPALGLRRLEHLFILFRLCHAATLSPGASFLLAFGLGSHGTCTVRTVHAVRKKKSE